MPGLKEKLRKFGKDNGPKCVHLKKIEMNGIRKIILGIHTLILKKLAIPLHTPAIILLSGFLYILLRTPFCTVSLPGTKAHNNMYAKNPIPEKINTSLTIIGSILNYAAIPLHTPPNTLLLASRYNLLPGINAVC